LHPSLQNLRRVSNTADLFEPANDPEIHVDGKLVVISIKGWGGMPTRGNLKPLKLPVSKVIISETPPEICKTQVCSNIDAIIHIFHSKFNFLFRIPALIGLE